jgi:hypothetical protein
VIPEPEYAPDRFERSIAAIHDLIDELGLQRHAIFGEVNEGTMFPDGTEAMSGYVVDEQGQTYAFWTGWDTERQGPIFDTWRPVAPEQRWQTDSEYLQARQGVGLDRATSRPG